jgi:hypothetical protein
LDWLSLPPPLALEDDTSIDWGCCCWRFNML